jgi:hypothetical protein
MAHTEDFSRLMPQVVERLRERGYLGQPTSGHHRKDELRFGTHGSLSVDLSKGVWRDHETDEGGGVLDLICRGIGAEKGDKAAAVNWLENECFVDSHRLTPKESETVRQARRPVTSHVYRDAQGTPLLEALRYADPKGFAQRRLGPDGKPVLGSYGREIWNIKGVPRVLYRLPELNEDIAAGRTIYVVEGEKDVDRLRSLGLPATTNPMGAGPGKWHCDYAEHLRGADVVVVPDNDEPGRKHAEIIIASLLEVAKRVRFLDLSPTWPDCPEKGDISDWLDADHSVEDLARLAEAAPERKLPEPRLMPRTIEDFLKMEIKPREMVLSPIIPEKGLAMLYAARGVGKTQVSTGMAYALAPARSSCAGVLPRRARCWSSTARCRRVPCKSVLPGPSVGLEVSLPRTLCGFSLVTSSRRAVSAISHRLRYRMRLTHILIASRF